jgi:hypothetical protein
MKYFTLVFATAMILGTLGILGSAVANDSTDVFQHVGGNGDKDSSVLIQTTKGAKNLNDYEIISGEEDLAGDPTAGMAAALKSWKEACSEWKKELKENNKDGQVLLASCGVSKFTKDESAGAGSGIYVYTSHGTYKLRVRIKDK